MKGTLATLMIGLFGSIQGAAGAAGAATDPFPADARQTDERPEHRDEDEQNEPVSPDGLDDELEQGYALLYELVSTLQHINKVFLVKFESDDVQALTDDVSERLTKVTEKLESMAAGNPGFDLENTGTPKFAGETRKAMSLARVKSFAPLVGSTGTDFERTLLLTQAGQLNQARYLSEVLADAEANVDRQRFLMELNGEFDELYGRVDELLEEQYYCKRRSASAREE
jgi:ribosomal protein L12E/L44/L45/RPP1/RPP2